MTCPNSDQLMADSSPKPTQSLASQPLGEKGVLTTLEGGGVEKKGEGERQGGLDHANSSSTSAVWASTLVLCQASSRALKARAWLAWPGHSLPRRAEHAHPSPASGSLNPKPLQRIACKLEPDMLRISKGVVSIFHTGLVIYNSLRVLTLRLGSSDNPPKMKPQRRGKRVGRGERPQAAWLLYKSRYSCICTPAL